jgi:hypothetical protein
MNLLTAFVSLLEPSFAKYWRFLVFLSVQNVSKPVAHFSNSAFAVNDANELIRLLSVHHCDPFLHECTLCTISIINNNNNS